jgi:quinol-cytochrome oxidoreductase complex cytochrome b subunit
MGAVIFHLQTLHQSGSSSKISTLHSFNKAPFDGFLVIKDSVNIVIIIALFLLILIYPYISADCENFIEANPIMSPLEIKPE